MARSGSGLIAAGLSAMRCQPTGCGALGGEGVADRGRALVAGARAALVTQRASLLARIPRLCILPAPVLACSSGRGVLPTSGPTLGLTRRCARRVPWTNDERADPRVCADARERKV